jgi:hypothetical protein
VRSSTTSWSLQAKSTRAASRAAPSSPSWATPRACRCAASAELLLDHRFKFRLPPLGAAASGLAGVSSVS